MIVFAINNKFSYTEVDEIMLKIKETCPDNVIKVLVGNKMDLEDDRKVLYEQAAEEVLLKGI